MDNNDRGKKVKLRKPILEMSVKEVNGNQITVEWIDGAEQPHTAIYLDSELILVTTEQERAAKTNIQREVGKRLGLV